MNTTISKLTSTAMLLCAFAACSDQQLLTEGEGRLHISARLNSDVTVVSRAETEDQLSASCTVWISNDKGVVRQYHGIDALPSEGISLLSGHYTAEGWAGVKSAASFEDRWFEGAQDFDIQRDQTTQVELSCKIQNTVVSVVYDESVADLINDYSMTVGNTAGSLTFEGDDLRKGYFMMPDGETDLNYTLDCSLGNGEKYTRKGTIANVRPATEYRMTVRYTGENVELGGAYLTIEVDEREIVVEDQILIAIAPEFTGYDFDINMPIRAKERELGHKAIYISACAALTNVVIEGEPLSSLNLGGNDFDLLTCTPEILAQIQAGGINAVYTYDEEQDVSGMKINFEEVFTNTLTNGEHYITITATDAMGKTSAVTLHFVISDAPVTTANTIPGEVYATHAVLHADVSGTPEACGFKYRVDGSSDWLYVAATIDGSACSAEISGLTPGTRYEYLATAGDFESRALSFTTESAAQLPNNSFESFWQDGKTIVFYEQGDEMFWDSGNHGSSTMNKNVTQCSTDKVHDGTYSAKLESQFVGIGSIGAFAAGNIFVGKFLGTENTTKGILGWGRKFTSRPTAMKVWAHYTPGTVNYYGGGDLKKDDRDEGIIYVALVDESTQTYGNYSGWPCIVATKIPQLFDPNGSNVIAYGEHVFKEATAGNDLVEITIPLDYHLTDIKASNIIVTASASRCGDYYTGGPSVLYIDDIQLVY